MSATIDPASRVPVPAQCIIEYATDALQMGALLLDVLRQRGNIYLDHASAGKPPVLAFKYEVVADGHELAHPVTYALARIIPPGGVVAPALSKRPFVVIDPRAGHSRGTAASSTAPLKALRKPWTYHVIHSSAWHDSQHP